jgi:hypothetical protein
VARSFQADATCCFRPARFSEGVERGRYSGGALFISSGGATPPFIRLQYSGVPYSFRPASGSGHQGFGIEEAGAASGGVARWYGSSLPSSSALPAAHSFLFPIWLVSMEEDCAQIADHPPFRLGV